MQAGVSQQQPRASHPPLGLFQETEGAVRAYLASDHDWFRALAYERAKNGDLVISMKSDDARRAWWTFRIVLEAGRDRRLPPRVVASVRAPRQHMVARNPWRVLVEWQPRTTPSAADLAEFTARIAAELIKLPRYAGAARRR